MLKTLAEGTCQVHKAREATRGRLRYGWARVVTYTLLGCFFAVTLISCSGEADHGGPTGPTPGERFATSFSAWAEQILAEQDAYLSDFAKEVIGEAARTGHIEPAAYEQAFSMYSSCMAEQGYIDTYVKDGFGIYKTTVGEKGLADVTAYGEAFSACWDGQTAIAVMWTEQQQNPDLFADRREAGVACLKKNGLVGNDYTVNDLNSDLDADFQSAPYDPFDPVANDCLRAGGIGIYG